MLGHAEAWFHQWLAGIQIDLTQPRAKQIVLRPTPVGDVTWTQASHDSVLGPVSIRWDRSRDRFKAAVSVPTDATLHMPDGAVHQIGPGSHRFECICNGS